MSMLPFFNIVSETFEVKHIFSEMFGAKGTTISTLSNLDLGEPHPSRTVFITISGRTNTTTGDRRFLITNSKITVDGVDYPADRIAAFGTDTSVASPIAIYKVPVPVGTSGSAQIIVSGSGTALAGGGWSFWVARGSFSDVSSSAVASSDVSVTGRAGGVILHHAGAASAFTGATYTFTDLDGSVSGHVAKAGRILPSAGGTTTITTTASRTAAVLIGAA